MNLPIILKFENFYLLWQETLLRVPKIYKYSIGNTLDKHLLFALENIYLCLQEEDPSRKLLYLKKANSEIDISKFLLNICYKNKSISSGQLENLTSSILEIGKILGGWKKGINDKGTLMSQTKQKVSK